MDRLAEQREYYRQRAPEYDEWWQSQGRYAKSPDDERRWSADIDQVVRALDDFAPTGAVLELAAGTGWWTEHLTRHAGHVTAVDASAETLALNRQRTSGRGEVSYVVADLFEWAPPVAAFDVVFFAYWLSHVPDDRLTQFCGRVAAALRPGGRIFVVDSYHHERLADDRQVRVLNDGRRFEVVKRFWQPAELESIPGWPLTATVTTNRHIIYAQQRRLLRRPADD
ncbi:class I SAM-dependent methyltransferase [Actinoplanes bogorensis]|uniref:Class I SAM-dependent methyltransferase n=1 Tax=Paractinoplanes bogorensis TaxID=1610840 RepID=A0ABS5Z0C8_9ACTN|nr:class I SAM-dependent methyltransferase [Actinoplanes bogorensis]MBU2669140.1 class I SAM-dependent methyltransferase [Actinoplanes bogorensis]